MPNSVIHVHKGHKLLKWKEGTFSDDFRTVDAILTYNKNGGTWDKTKRLDVNCNFRTDEAIFVIFDNFT